eukprot:1192750-Prorocentrum_minimum.AAC.5
MAVVEQVGRVMVVESLSVQRDVLGFRNRSGLEGRSEPPGGHQQGEEVLADACPENGRMPGGAHTEVANHK